MSKTTGLKGPSMWVVGNDQGYLDTAQQINPNLKPGKLAMMPGERYEVIIDFTGLGGQVLEMRNTARTPYVGGAPSTAPPPARSSSSGSPPRRSRTAPSTPL